MDTHPFAVPWKHPSVFGGRGNVRGGADARGSTPAVGPQLSMRRTRTLAWSTMSNPPLASVDRSSGMLNAACRAGPLSPLNPPAPVPASAKMTPVARFTVRIRSALLSDSTRLPAESSVRPCSSVNVAEVAAPPSPPFPGTPVPATVEVAKNFAEPPRVALRTPGSLFMSLK